MRRIVVSTGGTGGHIFPALAVVEEIREAHPSARVIFIGGDRGPEGDLARKAGLEFVGLPAKGVLGRGMKSLSAPLWLTRSFMRCVRLYRASRPDVVIGFGGYASFMPVMAASMLAVPTAVHEQNSMPGKANRLLSRFADKVFLSFPDEGGFFQAEKTVLTGNPVRKSIIDLWGKTRTVSEIGRHVLILGGSQGAKAVNNAILSIAPQLQAMGASIMHQTGPRDFERVKEAYKNHGFVGIKVIPFIDDMTAAYDWADLVICRAGATTVAEVAVAGRPCIFIPFPYATHNHQSVNAHFLAKEGAAVVIEEKDLTDDDLAKSCASLLDNPQTLAEMSSAARKLGRPQAAVQVVGELEKIVSRAREQGKKSRSIFKAVSKAF